MAIQESKEECYQKALEFIIEHALYQDAWYVLTARDALGEERSYNPQNCPECETMTSMNLPV